MPDINDHKWISTHCWFCESEIKFDDDGMFVENEYGNPIEVGEFWSEKLNNSVMAHPDCLPEGTLEGTNDEWSMA